MIKKDKFGFYYVSKKGIRYEILEGMTAGAEQRYTSDIIFIFLQNPDFDLDNYCVGYIFGFGGLDGKDEKWMARLLDGITEQVEAFEKANLGE